MKKGFKVLAGILSAALLLGLAGCAGTPETVPTETTAAETVPTETTAAETEQTVSLPETETTAEATLPPAAEIIASADPQIYHSYDSEDLVVPILVIRENGDAERVVWDLENHDLTEPELLCRLDLSKEIGSEYAWTGRNVIIGTSELAEAAEGVTYVKFSDRLEPYGSCFTSSGSIYIWYVTEDGAVTKTRLPASIGDNPSYAAFSDGQIFPVYVTERLEEAGNTVVIRYDVRCGSYPADDPYTPVEWVEQERDSTIGLDTIPTKSIYQDGKVYFASAWDFFILDLASGEITASGIGDQARRLFPQEPGTWNFYVEGYYSGIMVVSYYWSEQGPFSDKMYQTYYAVKDGAVLGALMKDLVSNEWTVYDGNLDMVGTADILNGRVNYTFAFES